MNHGELVDKKVFYKVYDRRFTKSSHNYLLKESTKESIESNYNAIITDHGSESMCVLNQVHSTDVIEVNGPWKIGSEPNADGFFTTKQNIILGIQTADCVPIIISSKDGEVIGAAHCGWRSAYNGIIGNLVSEMQKKSNSDFVAIIGPSIQQDSYEVSSDFYDNFIDQSIQNSIYFRQKNDEKYLFDLPSYVKNQLEAYDVEVIKHINDDTYLMPEQYPSYRYAMHNNLRKYKGSILTTIVKK